MDNKGNERFIDDNANNLLAYQKLLKEFTGNISDYMVGIQNVIIEFTTSLVEVQETIVSALKPIKKYEKVLLTIDRLGKNQFVYWDYISEELITDIIQTEDINAYMCDFYIIGESPYIESTIIHCERSRRMNPYTKLFSESISAYYNKQYYLAILGLLSIVDGLLSDISEDSGVSISNRALIILDKLSLGKQTVKDDISTLTLYATFTDMITSISKHALFNGEEPELLNRHWLMHGRSRKTISNIDCIKIINYIYGILLLDTLNE